MNARECEELLKDYAESMGIKRCYNRKINASREVLKKATEELEEKPACGVLQCEILRLQEDISRMSAEYDQEHRLFLRRRSMFLQAQTELYARYRNRQPQIEMDQSEPGSYKWSVYIVSLNRLSASKIFFTDGTSCNFGSEL